MSESCVGYEIEMRTIKKEFIKFGYEMKRELNTITLIKFNHFVTFERSFDKKRGIIFTCIKNQFLKLKGGENNG